ncbi:uncharacterized protein SAPINGB_P002584 [Magnusiomyces paraingens]|uniref:Methylcrotonoyl-CoA carboxylase subunit alpha, mitochondrial n=1 Tax=Magnusiomyces paraingens TaxID=2606893 RepID=A0A5E8BKF5_9ASCO|nr:uncharacterized protein SAPINGB_P002584 [Saprochaete ingens]VVT50067.1 unnamed protein product [Saprochaete ingens]
MSQSSIVAKPLRSLYIANRGEIVHRISRTASRMGIDTTTVYTTPDAQLPSATSAFTNLSLGDATSGYIDIDRVVATAKNAGCDSIHPGYGFLSENATFARKVREAGLIFVGPPQGAIESMGAKSTSKEIMIAANVPVVPGYHGSNQDAAFLLEQAKEIGFPVLIKAILGGGGKGMRIVQSAEEFPAALASAKSEAKSSFGDENVLVEKYIRTPRHIEVQVFADKYGNVVALGERDCSVQRRHQKVLEESPAPGLDEDTRQNLWEKARLAARAVGYEGAGTVEFIFDNDSGDFYFMEMNTRLQVEHPVTEAVTNTDLVEWQLLVAAGFPLPKTQEEVEITGHAIEARIYCEDAFKDFLPSSGKIVHMQVPTTGDPRLDITFKQNSTVSPLYDPMIGKLIVNGESRDEALRKLRRGLQEFEIVGPVTNIEFVKRIVEHEGFAGDDPSALETGFISKNKKVLTAPEQVPDEVYAQAALAQIAGRATPLDAFSRFSGAFNSWSVAQVRSFEFIDTRDEKSLVSVKTLQTGPHSFRVIVSSPLDTEPREPLEVKSVYFADSNAVTSGPSRKLHIQFSTGQYVNTVVAAPAQSTGGSVHVFHRGTHYSIAQPSPAWLQTALGVKETKNSVVAPMPCKVVRLAPGTTVGSKVEKDDELLVIESMKMETVIRAPHAGIVKRVAHEAGDIVKQGTLLVEFEEEE